jgi:hypothetical protein
VTALQTGKPPQWPHGEPFDATSSLDWVRAGDTRGFWWASLCQTNDDWATQGPELCEAAAAANHLDMLKLLCSMGYGYDERAVHAAAAAGNLSILPGCLVLRLHVFVFACCLVCNSTALVQHALE